MVIVSEEHARQSMMKRARHHAKPLVPVINPIMDLVIALADKDNGFKSKDDGFMSVEGKAITLHKTTGNFRVNGRWIGFCANDNYDGVEFYDWRTGKKLSDIPA